MILTYRQQIHRPKLAASIGRTNERNRLKRLKKRNFSNALAHATTCRLVLLMSLFENFVRYKNIKKEEKGKKNRRKERGEKKADAIDLKRANEAAVLGCYSRASTSALYFGTFASPREHSFNPFSQRSYLSSHQKE